MAARLSFVVIGMGGEGTSKIAQRRRQQFDLIQEELVEALIGYGGSLTMLGPDERVTLAAFPWQDSWGVTPNPIRALSISARFSDLRAHGEDRLSEDEMRRRLEIREVPK